MSRRTQELLIRLGESLGKNIGDTRRQKTMQDAFQTFSKDLSKENIEQFMARHPDMSPADIYPLASYINTQAGGVRLNDAGATAVGRIAQMKQAGESIDATSMKKIIEESGANLPLNEQMKHRQNIFNFLKEEGPKISWHKEDEVPIETDPFTGGVKRVGGPGMEGFGPKVEMSKVKEDGTISTVKARPSEVAEYKNKGYEEGTIKEGKTITPSDVDKYIEKLKESGRIKTPEQEARARLFFKREPNLPSAGEKPEYKPGAALNKVSTIDSAIARLKSTGMVDAAIAIQNPELAAIIGTKDPEAVQQAIQSLQQQRAYVAQFIPKGSNVNQRSLPEAALNPPKSKKDNVGYIQSYFKLYAPKTDQAAMLNTLSAAGYSKEEIKQGWGLYRGK